jgi:phenylacetate-coenzyme A ligase PaaK-like adenylate-forming protein
MDIQRLQKKIFEISSADQFNEMALEVFHFQYENNEIYHRFCSYLGVKIQQIEHYSNIPFLPIEFFKNHKIIAGNRATEIIFSSSGTTGSTTSQHHVCDINLYEISFLKSFEMFVGKPEHYHILALLPSYQERQGSSLIYMVDRLIELSSSPHSGYYLYNLDELGLKIKSLTGGDRQILLIGVTYALLDLADRFSFNTPELRVMETGGMKGRRKEMIREELHQTLQTALGVSEIMSEYGMTELLSQAYALRNGEFFTPPWMKVIVKDLNDPFRDALHGRTGQIAVIDLANLFSCSFISTQDLGKQLPGNGFSVLGRFDHSDIRGCNLMIG